MWISDKFESKEGSIIKISQFSENMAAGQKVKEKHPDERLWGQPRLKKSSPFCQQWSGQSRAAFSFTQGQYHNWEGKETEFLPCCWSQTNCSLRFFCNENKYLWLENKYPLAWKTNGYTMVIPPVLCGLPVVAKGSKTSKNPANFLCLAPWNKDCFTAAHNSSVHLLRTRSDELLTLWQPQDFCPQYAISDTIRTNRHGVHLYSGTEMYSHYGTYLDFIPARPITAHCSNPCLIRVRGWGADRRSGMGDVLLRGG